MKRKEMTFLAIGLLVGFLIGAAANSEDVNLFGTAGVEEPKAETQRASQQVVFYAAELPQVTEWLAASAATTNTALSADVEAVNTITDQAIAGQSLVQDTTTGTYSAFMRDIVGQLSSNQANLDTLAGDGSLKMCVGYEEDLYNPGAAPVTYVAIEIEAAELQNLDIPANWQELQQPKSTFWTLIFCYTPEP